MGDSNYKKSENPNYGTGWITLGNPGPLWPGTEGEIWETPPREPGYQYPTNHGYDYTVPPNSLTTYDHYPPVNHHKHVANGWKQIGTLVLLKLGFLKILFFLIYKIVIFTRLTSLKFQLINKATDFFMNLPAFIMGLFTTIMNILMSVLMLFNSITTPVNQGQLPGPSILPSRVGGVIPYLWNNLVKRISPSSSSGEPIRTGISGRTVTDSRLQSKSVKNRNPSLNSERFFESNDLNLVNKHSYEPLRLFEPTFSQIVKNVLDSEKCVERIICQIAAAEKSGAVPFYWFHW